MHDISQYKEMQTAFLLIWCLLCMRSCWFYRNSTHTFCWFEFWMFYTRSLLNIEISWDDQDSFVLYALQQRFLDLCICMLTYRLEETLSSWSSHLKLFDLKKSLSSWSSHLKSYHSSRFISVCVKNLKIIFVNDSEKAWSDDFTVCCFQYRESDFVQFTVFVLMTDSWLSDRKIEFEFFFIFYSLYFLYWNRWVAWRRMIRRERRRIDAIALNISDFENLLDFLLLSHHNTQRSVRSSSSLWRCFWHDSVLHAS